MNEMTINDLDRDDFICDEDGDYPVMTADELQEIWNDLDVYERECFLLLEEVPISHSCLYSVSSLLDSICEQIDDQIDRNSDYLEDINNKENRDKLSNVLAEIFEGKTYFEKGVQIDPYVDYKGE